MDLDDYSWKNGLSAVFAAVFANSVLVALSQNMLETSTEFEPLTFGPIVFITAIAGIGGYITWELLNKYRTKPVKDLLRISTLVLVLSFGTVLFATGEPGAGMTEIAMLSLSHVLAAAVFVGTLLELET